jgi:AraC-like DNA-binding protein
LKLLRHIGVYNLLKINLVLGLLFVHFVSFSQVSEYENYQKKLDKLSGQKKLSYYRTVVAQLEKDSPVLTEKILRDAIRDSEIQKDTLRLIQFHRAMGGVKHNMSQYNASSIHFHTSVEYAEKYGNSIELNKSKVKMTMVYLYNREFDKGITNLKRAIEGLKGTKEDAVLGVAYSNLGGMYREKGEFDQAISNYKEASKIQKRINDEKNLGITYANLGSVFAAQDKFEEGLSYLEKAEMVLSKAKVKDALSFVYLEYSKIHQKREAHSQALVYANLALELARNTKSLDNQAKSLNQLALIAYEQNDFEVSIGFLIEQMILQDSLNKSLQSKHVRETSAVYSVFEAERQAVELKHQVVLEQGRFRFVLAISIGVSLLLLLMIIMWARIRSKNKVLFEQSLKTIAPTKPKVELEEEDIEKYKTLYDAILEQFEAEKMYLDSSLTMGMLSDIVRSNSNYVSKSINIYFGSNFNSMINFYRVNEAKKMIESGALDKFTMETVASNCGFTSLSVFNRSFKKETGITPTYFNKSLNLSSN